MPRIFSDWQGAYAERGLPTFPVDPIADGGKTKKPCVKHYDKIGLRASQQLALRFLDTNGLACMAGARNRLTLVDIDARGAEADRLTADAQCMYGRSLFIVRTGRDGRHLYYRHHGEGRRIRPNPECPIDILGGGVVVLPPSLGAEQPYEVIEGRLDDLTALTTIKNAPTPPDAPAPPDQPMLDIPRDLTGMRDGDARNNALFGIMLRNGHYLPPTIEAFIEFAREENAKAAEPMIDTRVVGTATSVFKYRQRGTLVHSGRGVWFPATSEPTQMIEGNLHLFGLLGWLKANNGPDAEFWVSDGLANVLAWSLPKLRLARRHAVEAGWIEQVAPPWRGSPARYRWGPASRQPSVSLGVARGAAEHSSRGVYLGLLTDFGRSYLGPILRPSASQATASASPTPVVLTVPHLERRDGFGLAFNPTSPPAWVLPMRNLASAVAAGKAPFGVLPLPARVAA